MGTNIKSFALTFIIFGLITLLNNLGLFSRISSDLSNFLVSTTTLFLLAGIIFICSQPKSFLGWVFIVVGVLLLLSSIFSSTFIASYAFLYSPIGLICAGVVLLFSRK